MRSRTHLTIIRKIVNQKVLRFRCENEMRFRLYLKVSFFAGDYIFIIHELLINQFTFMELGRRSNHTISSFIQNKRGSKEPIA